MPEGVPITVEALLKHHKYLPRPPMLRTVPPEERERTIDPEIGTRSLAVMGTDMAIRQRHARCAFSNADAVLPDVELLVFWCDQSVWFTTWGAKVFDDLVSEAPVEGKRKRPASIFRIRGANHCVSLATERQTASRRITNSEVRFTATSLRRWSASLPSTVGPQSLI